MTFKEYQKKALDTLFPNNTYDLVPRLTLGVCGEAGEIAEKVKKWLRGDYGSVPTIQIGREIADCTWYLAVLCETLGLDYEELMKENIKKLASRKVRGKIKGNGDER